MPSRLKLYGVAEIAQALGMRRETIAQWHLRGKLPEPDAVLAMGPVWTEATIRPWLRRQERGKQ